MAGGKLARVYKAPRGKKSYYKPRRRYRKQANLPSPVRNPMGTSLNPAYRAGKTVKMRYATTISMNPATSSVANHLFSCNDLYDPDETGTGHQPMGFDEYANYYVDYTVLKATCRITPTTNNIDLDSPASVFSLSVVESSTAPSDPMAIIENNRSVWRVLPFSQNVRPPTLSITYDASKHFGVKDPQDVGEIGTTFTDTSGPASQMYFLIQNSSIDGVTDIAATDILVVIDFLVKLGQPKTVGQS